MQIKTFEKGVASIVNKNFGELEYNDCADALQVFFLFVLDSIYDSCYLFWPSVRKNVLVFQKFKAEGWEFANILRELKEFIGTVKGQNNFSKRMLLWLVSQGFSDLIY